jgi:membrane protein
MQDHRQDRPPSAMHDQAGAHRVGQKALGTARARLEGSIAQRYVLQLRVLDFANQALLFGAGLLSSLLPFVILLSAFANKRVDDDISLRLGLNHRAEGIVARLFASAPATASVSTATSLAFVTVGTLAVASSLQQIYEKVFHQDHRGMRDILRLLAWVVVLCLAVALESLVIRPLLRVSGGHWLEALATVALMTPFFWWTMHFLLAGRVPWRKLLPSAIVTGIFFAGLGAFSRLYFSGTIISDSQTYGSVGAIFSILTWLIAVGAVIILGAVAGAVWEDRTSPIAPPSEEVSSEGRSLPRGWPDRATSLVRSVLNADKRHGAQLR